MIFWVSLLAVLGSGLLFYRKSWKNMLFYTSLSTFVFGASMIFGMSLLNSSGLETFKWGLSRFDSDFRKSAKTNNEGFNPRSKMVARLLSSDRLTEKSRSEIHSKLGEADCIPTSDNSDAWELGFVSGWQIDMDCSHIWYDDFGRTKRIEWMQH